MTRTFMQHGTLSTSDPTLSSSFTTFAPSVQFCILNSRLTASPQERGKESLPLFSPRGLVLEAKKNLYPISALRPQLPSGISEQ